MKEQLSFYQPEDLPDLLKSCDFVVGKPAGFPDQYLIGPRAAVEASALGFKILDFLGSGEARTMSVVILPELSNEEEKEENEIAFLNELLERVRIKEMVRGSSFGDDLFEEGVFPDVRNPVATLPDLTNRFPSQSVPLIYAGFFRHEGTHVEQKHKGLPCNSLWAERCAMSKEGLLLLTILNSNHLDRLSQEELILRLRFLSKNIRNYRNGEGFDDHLTHEGDLADGNPVRKQKFHPKDFVFDR